MEIKTKVKSVIEAMCGDGAPACPRKHKSEENPGGPAPSQLRTSPFFKCNSARREEWMSCKYI